MRSLDLEHKKPHFKCRGSLVFKTKGNRPDKTGVVIYYVHGIQATSAGGDRHGSTQIDIYPPKRCNSPRTFPNLWNRRSCLFAKDTVFTFGRQGGGVDWHTLDDVGTGHVDYSSMSTVAKVSVPCVNAW